MKWTIVLLLFVSIAEISLGQGSFKVLASKGDNNYKTNDGSWEAIKTGMNLDEDAIIKIGDQPYLGLMHSSGFNVVLKEAGTHSLEKLKNSNQESSILKKYMAFIDSKMNESGPSNRLEATGAVERATGDEISIYLPKRASYNENEVLISWTDIENIQHFNIQVTNMLGEVLFEEAVNQNMVQLDLSDKRFESPVLLVKVQSGDGSVSSGQHAIVPVEEEKREAFSQELEAIKSSINEVNSLNALVLAEFYSRNDCMVDAVTYYRKAMELAPDVVYFQELFKDFTSRF